MAKKNWYPALTLFFLAPMIGELLSGSAPPLEFFNPVVFIMLALSYGCSAVIIRELVCRWKKGWNSIFVLGAAYAFVNEGLSAKSFFDPNWIDIGILGHYGRLFGINWVWSFGLIAYHIIISISIPILIVTLIFPKQNSLPWISRRMFNALGILLIADTIFIYFNISEFRVPLIYLIATIASIAILIFAAKRVPEIKYISKKVNVPKARWFWLVGFLAAFVFFLVFDGLPKSGIHPIISVSMIAAVILIAVWLVYRMSCSFSAWRDKHRLALSSGVLGALILFTPVLEFEKHMAGMVAVGASFAAFLVWLNRAIVNREK